jgi:hypothetical protein
MAIASHTPMPAQHDRSAPVFKYAYDLPGYIDELERLFSEHGVTNDRDKINASLRYLPHYEMRVWKSFKAFTDTTKTWQQFKDEVISFYPGAAIEGLSTRSDLEAIVSNRAAAPIDTRAELGEYTRRFKVLATDLLQKPSTIFSEHQANEFYIRGFARGDLLKKLLDRLEQKHPDHNAEAAYDRDEVFAEADKILSGQGSAASRLWNASAPVTIKQEDVPPTMHAALKAQETALKAQASAFETRMTSLESMFSSFMSAFASGASAAPPVTPRPLQQFQPATTNNTGCHFCGGSCIIRNCPEVARYIQLGLLARGTDGRLVLPGGTYIPSNRTSPNSTMKERVDDWHRTHPGHSTMLPRDSATPPNREQPPHLNTNFLTFSPPCPNATASGFLLESTPASATAAARIVELEEDETDPVQSYLRSQLALCTQGDPRVHVLEAELSKRRAEVSDGVEKVRASSRANKGKAAVRFADEQHNGRANDDIRNRPAPAPIREATPARDDSPPPEPLRVSDIPQIPAPAQSAQVPSATAAPGPRPSGHSTRGARIVYPPKQPRPAGHSGFRNVAPVEEELRVDKLVDTFLDSPLSNVTGRQLFGASYAARRELASRITPRKVVSEGDALATALYSSGPPPPLTFECPECGDMHDHASANRLQKLRILRPLISNQIEAECVIDSGSEGVMMRKDIWAATGLPLYVNDAINITAANSTTTRTLGGLRNVLFNISGMEIFLQVQVIEEAPWEVLLGRSFFTHTACETKDSPDGSSVLTLTHPETGERVQVPTIERPNRHSPRKVQGFA